MAETERIGLALSGGGVRAMCFHLGVFRALSESNLLERIHYLSSVSGGTLITGLVFSRNGNRWPDSKTFLERIHPEIRILLTTKSLQRGYILSLLNPFNWILFPTRANVLAKTISRVWGIRSSLGDLPSNPTWAINCTCVESGKRWRFKESSMGDYLLGFADAPQFPLSDAMASSAAFPGGVSPLKVATGSYNWYGYSGWGIDDPKKIPKTSPPSPVHIADGGIYDNMGLEPLYDAGRMRIKPECACTALIVSDAGSPLGMKGNSSLAQFLGFSMRTIEMIHDQAKNLRVRTLIPWMKKNDSKGLYIEIAKSCQHTIELAKKYGRTVPDTVEVYQYQAQEQALKACKYPTDLNCISQVDFDQIERHGFESAKALMGIYW